MSFWWADRFLPGFVGFVLTFPAVMAWNLWLSGRKIDRAARSQTADLKEHLVQVTQEQTDSLRAHISQQGRQDG